MKFRHRVLAIATVLVLIPSLSGAQTSGGDTDQQIQAKVERSLASEGLSNVSVSAAHHVVTLMGSVRSAWDKKRAIEAATKIRGVTSVSADLTIPAADSEAALAEALADKLRAYAFYTIYDDVNVNVDGGVVTLTGHVMHPHKGEELSEIASRVHGVQDVKNALEALPASVFDNELRVAIARQIYRDPLFWNYALQPDPPVHIIVNGGRVILTGVVDSEIERRKAEVIARSTFGVMRVDNQLRTVSIRTTSD